MRHDRQIGFRRLWLALLAGAAAAAIAFPAAAAAAQKRADGFADANCVFYQEYGSTDQYKRDASVSIALIATNEGYHWGGGCWNDDNVDNSPGEPLKSEWTHGEGGDCAGLVWHVWREHAEGGSGTRFWFSTRWYYHHGPYGTWNYHANPNTTDLSVAYNKPGLIKMDVFASSEHMALVWYKLDAGTDVVIEAKGEAYGTNAWTRSYRANPAYHGSRRLGWTG